MKIQGGNNIMTPEENQKRQQDENVKYLKKNICNKDGDKDFVFISYKSDDWETVLQDITYRLVKDYGLNIYFDGDFDLHNESWISQFPENMESAKCKGVLAFIDDNYATSYATLMELMYSQTFRCGPKSVVPINLADLTEIEDRTDTGLGKRKLNNGILNHNAEKEKTLFDRTLRELLGSKKMNLPSEFKDKYYNPAEDIDLDKRRCSGILGELLSALGVNNNYYTTKGESLDAVAATIRNTFGESVFSRINQPSNASVHNTEIGKERDSEVNTVENVSEEITGTARLNGEKTENIIEKISQNKKIALKEFLEIYNIRTFQESSFESIQLIGINGKEKYSTEKCKTSREMLIAFATKIIDEMGMSYIELVNSYEKGKNPIFITTEEYKEKKAKNKSAVQYAELQSVKVRGYSMNTKYGSYDCIRNSLRKQLQALGWNEEDFYLEFE